MKVRILQNLPTVIDGKRLGPFTAGQEIDMNDAQAALFIGSAMAEEVLPEPEPETIEVQPVAESYPVQVSRRKKAE